MSEQCVWCSKTEPEHGDFQQYEHGDGTLGYGRLCPVPGVTSQFFTPPYVPKLEKLDKIIALCRRYNSPAVNVATHALARKVLEIAEGKQ